MDPTRRSLLLSGAAASILSRRAWAGGVESSAPKYLIVVVADGGWDVTYSIDPKPVPGPGQSAPVDGPWTDDPVNEYQGEINGIPLQLNDKTRWPVNQFFENHGTRACVVNGVWTGSIVHQPSRIRILTGTTDAANADFATTVGAARGVSVDLPLGTIDFSGLGYTGELSATTGRIGYSSQLKSLLVKDSSFGPPSWADYVLPLYTPTSDEDAAVKDHLLERIAAYRKEVGGIARNDKYLDDMVESYGRRERMLENADLIAGDLELGVRPTLDKQVSIAVDLLKNGVCHTVSVASELVWDTHDGNTLQHDRYFDFYTSLNTLADKLVAEGLMESTLVVVVSEMTRTPKLNVKGGKDHWPHTSQLWFGAGVNGGRVVGATDENLVSQAIDLVSGEASASGELNKYDNIVAGILCHMGLDSEAYMPGVNPFRAATT